MAAKPKAFWPLTITAGVNDKIDVVQGGITRFGLVAPGTYDSPADVIAAILAALPRSRLAAVGASIAAWSAGGSTWSAGTIPAATYNAVASNGADGGRLVAVGNTGACATSDDGGATWTARTIPAGTYYDVAWSQALGLWIAVGASVAATSPDGITWTARTIPAGNWTGVWARTGAAPGDVVAVACGIGGLLASSTNGTSWTSRTSAPAAADYYGIVHTGTRWVAVGAQSGAGKGMTSTDGISWVESTVPAPSWARVAWNGSRLVATSQNSASAAMTSDDGGITWTQYALPAVGTWSGLAWDGSLWCAVGRTAGSVKLGATSPDGQVWTDRSAAMPAGAYTGVAPYLPVQAWTVTVSATGRVTVGNPAAFSLLFATGAYAATSARDVLGFGTVDTPSATSATGQYQHQNGWYADRPVGNDHGDTAERDAAENTALDGTGETLLFGTPAVLREIELVNLPPSKTKIALEGAAVNEAVERLWRDGAGGFRWWPDASVPGTFADYRLTSKALTEFKPKRLYKQKELYGYTLQLRRA